MSNPVSPPRALGIDLGEARIGLALSDALGMLAHPCETVDGRGPDPMKRVLEIIKREKVSVVVLGLPRNMNGTDGPAAAKARTFAEALRKRAPACEVRLLDERLSTVAAQKALHARGRNVKKSRPIIDQVAAQMLLQTYLDGEAHKRRFNDPSAEPDDLDEP
jgi:putative Holliday junction resolvase